MSVLVTGAAGFIGQHLVDLLSSREEEVHVLCRGREPQEWLTDKNIKVFKGDILDPLSVHEAMSGCDRVFHLAGYARNWARDPNTFFAVNVGGLSIILETAKKLDVSRVVFTSSALTMGPSEGTVPDGSTLSAESPFTNYEQSKRTGEELAWRHVQDGQDIVIVNPTRVFGSGLLNEGNSVTRMIKWYMEGKWRLAIGSGREIGNYAFVRDVALGHVLAMERGITGARYILGGENISYAALFELAGEISGRHYRQLQMPDSLAFMFAWIEERQGKLFRHQPLITAGWVKVFLRDWACSLTRTEKDLGYRFTPLREALKYTIDWLRNGESPRITSEVCRAPKVIASAA